MKTVWKFDIPVDDQVHAFQVPPGSPVMVGTQVRPDVVQLWMEVAHESADRQTRRFQVFGTGHDVPWSAVHVGSVIAHRLPDLVWHVYEVFEEDS